MKPYQGYKIATIVLSLAVLGCLFYIFHLRTVPEPQPHAILMQSNTEPGATEEINKTDSICYSDAWTMHEQYKNFFVLKTANGDTLEGICIDLSKIKKLMARKPKELYVAFAVDKNNLHEIDPAKKVYTTLVAGLDSNKNFILDTAARSVDFNKPIVYDYCDPCPSYCGNQTFSSYKKQ